MQNSNFDNPSLITNVTSFTDAWKTISGFSDWHAYKELTFVTSGQYADREGCEQGNVTVINTSLITNNMVVVLYSYLGTDEAGEIKIKFLSSGKISVITYTSENASVDYLKIYGR